MIQDVSVSQMEQRLEVVGESELGDNDEEAVAPLGEVRCLEVKRQTLCFGWRWP
jgi:hypothetical protein